MYNLLNLERTNIFVLFVSQHQLRAPEEIINAPLTEKIDVYSVGNVFYSILTGLLVNRNCDISKAHYRVSRGKTEPLSMDYFESRSAAEFALAKAIQWCWTFDFSDRPSIFEVVEFLENEVKNNSNPGKISD